MIDNKNLYTKSFYQGQMNESLDSAHEVVPYLMRLFSPKSVLDVGCGIGTWTSFFIEEGVKDVLGLDGEYVNSKQLLIPNECFKAQNLKQDINLSKRFDVALSLEVIEHLDQKEGIQLVATLVRHAPIIVFSGAIPFQGGTNHINEQWQSYWALEFAKHNYEAYDILRPIFWNNKKVNNCYKQNTIVYIDKSFTFENNDKIKNSLVTDLRSLDIVHPDAWISRNEYFKINISSIVRHYLRTVRAVFHKLF